jgi:hypothetical protein
MVDIPEVIKGNISVFKGTEVGKVGMLQDSLALVEKNPRILAKKYFTYYKIVEDLFNLSPEEISIIKLANNRLESKRGADEFLKVMGEKKTFFLAQMRQIGNLNNPHNQEGIKRLTQMMNNAWTIKQEDPNWTPKDGDPRADEVIWGFVKGASNPEINIDFSLCHGLERTLTTYFPDTEFTKKKDWLLCALNDVIALKGLKDEGYEKDILSSWSRPRPDGLGWISQRTLDVYRELIKTGK